ncbi:MAG: penicillin-binding protein [Bacteroidetes bacterium]|nr:penicillin-binding protein [Bacteroidota bacterium]HET6245538.1 transglycosylase domain-containing protein [Bacteroidia bacterium]
MNKKFSGYRKWIVLFWVFILFVIAIPVLVISGVNNGLFGELPSFEELENPKNNLASEIYSSDKKLLGKYYIQNRTTIPYEDISPNVCNGLVATEDVRFYNHSGVDARSLFRVFFRTLIGGDQNAGGGSTITQQLAKMLFHDRPQGKMERGVQKLKEWVIAAKLERFYTKHEIMAMYLNRFDFVNNAVGIKSAARIYFNTTPDSLNIQEAAMLVGMAKNPSFFNPLRRPEETQHRRNVVLYQMASFDNPQTNKPYLSKSEFDSLKVLPLGLDYKKEDHLEGLATYFREYLRFELKKWASENKKPDGSYYNINTDGLKIYTTIDSRMQQYAEEAVAQHMGKELQDEFFKHWKGKKNAPFFHLNDQQTENLMNQSMKRSERYRNLVNEGINKDSILKNFNTPVEMAIFSWKGDIDTLMSPMDSILYYKHFLRTGFMSMDPKTGAIKAWVGGINSRHFSYDHVKQGKRQVGSTFKPFVYALAMQEFWSPCYKVPNVPVSFELPEGKVWTPKNSDGKYGGMMTLKEGLATSTNSITAYIMKQFGPEAVVTLVRKMGVTAPLDAVPSLCLGTADISVFEMVGANSTFANKGVWTEPNFITRIEDKNGNVLKTFIPQQTEAMSEESAYLTLKLMQGVVESGTGTRLRFRFKLSPPIAGKTGTTQNNSDGWFIGLTPDLVSGVWVGGEDRSIHFRSTHLGQGANMALPIWALYMQKVYADPTITISKGDFERPTGKLDVEVDCAAYKIQNTKSNFE